MVKSEEIRSTAVRIELISFKAACYLYGCELTDCIWARFYPIDGEIGIKLTGFNDKQIEFAARWWGAMLIGEDLKSHEKLRPELANRQETIDQQDLFADLLSSVRSPRFAATQLNTFVSALQQNIAASIKSEQLQKANRGGRFLVLEETSLSVSGELKAACAAANIHEGYLSEYGHNQALILHDDGQIYNEGRGYSHGQGRIMYPGCPKPDFQIVKPKEIVFPDKHYQALYDKVLVLPLPAGTPVPKGVRVPIGIKGFNTFNPPKKFPEAVYLSIREDQILVAIDTLKPDDILKKNIIPREIITVENRYYTYGQGPMDSIKDSGNAPYNCPGHKLEATNREGVYQNVSLPFQLLDVSDNIQFGAGSSNVRLKKGDQLLKFEETRFTGSDKSPVELTPDRGARLCVFPGPIPPMRPIRGPSASGNALTPATQEPS